MTKDILGRGHNIADDRGIRRPSAHTRSKKMSRFVNLNDGQIEELIDSKDSASTKKVVVRGKTLFLEYAATKGYTEENVSTLSAADIDQLFFGFYPVMPVLGIRTVI